MSNSDAREAIPFRPSIMLGRDPEGHLVCLIADLPSEPGVVGIMFADAVRHVANCYADTDDPEDPKRAAVVMEISRVFMSEMSKPTAPCKMITKAGGLHPAQEEIEASVPREDENG